MVVYKPSKKRKARPLKQRLLCGYPNCKRTFQRDCERARHWQCSGHTPDCATVPETTITTRKSYTFQGKRDALLEYDGMRAEGVVNASSKLANIFGISKSTLSEWEANRATIFLRAKTRGMAKMRKYRPSNGDYPEAESKLYARFVWRRKYLRQKVTKAWLKRNMANILLTNYNITSDGFRCSQGWCGRFCKRWEITEQCRTNKHKASVVERLPRIRDFHQWLIYGLQRSAPQRCEKYGRFPPERMFHMDQVPLQFSSSHNRTLNLINEPCEIKEVDGSKGTKRMCSLQVCICAEPSQQVVALEVIFKGTGTRLTAEEKALYESLPITIRFQKKAWADEMYMIEWFERFREQTLDLGEVLLGMDGHGSQKTPLCMAFMQAMDIVPAFTPANCTDCVSPVDSHVGQTLKRKIAKRFDATYADNQSEWDRPAGEGGLTDTKRRMLVAQWASESWQEMCAGHHKLIRSAFVRTGFLIAKDGSENGLIELWPVRKVRGQERQWSSKGPGGEIYNFD